MSYSSSSQSNAVPTNEALNNTVLTNAAENALRSQRYEVSITADDYQCLHFVAHGVRECFSKLVDWAVLSDEGLCQILDAYSYDEANFCRELFDNLPADEVIEVSHHLGTVIEMLRIADYTVEVEITAA